MTPVISSFSQGYKALSPSFIYRALMAAQIVLA
jgi:hypothetical protein